MPSLVRIDLRNKLQCESSPTRLGSLYPERGDLLAASDVLAIDDQESLTLQFARAGRDGQTRTLLANLVARTVASVVWSDGSFDEWRVGRIAGGRAVQGTVEVACNPISQDLAEGADSSTGKGLVSAISAGRRVFDYAVMDATATDIWDNYIIPACPTWVTRGTIDSTFVMPLVEWNRLTPWALALQVRDTLRRMGATCELRLRRNGTTDYKLDLVTQVGSSAATPTFHPRVSLQSLHQSYDTTLQATRLFVSGSADPTGNPGIPGRARWRVVSVNAGAKTCVLEDPNSGAGPIGFVNQWASAYLIRTKTARANLIVSTDPTTQTFTLTDTPNFVADEWMEIRLTEPQDNNLSAGGTRYAISAVGGTSLTLSGDPITTDNQYQDWIARVWDNAVGGSFVRDCRISASVAATDILTVNATAGATTSHYVEFIQLDGDGEVPTYLEHPTYVQAPPTGYGAKVGDLVVERAFGVTQFVENPWMRTWTTAGNPPDGYTRAIAAGTASRNSNTDFTRYGGFSQYLDLTNATPSYLQTPRFDLVRSQSDFRVSVRCQVYFAGFANGAAEIYVEVRLVALNPDGTPKGTATDGTPGAALAKTRVSPEGTSSAYLTTNDSTVITTGEWIMMEIAGAVLTDSDAPHGLAVMLSNSTGGGVAITCQMYIDSFEAYGFEGIPAGVYEFGDATVLHQAGNLQLGTNAAPLVSYDVGIADLERADPTSWSRNAITLGGSARVVDTDFALDATVRVLRIERDLLKPEQTTLTLANRATLLPEVVQTL